MEAPEATADRGNLVFVLVRMVSRMRCGIKCRFPFCNSVGVSRGPWLGSPAFRWLALRQIACRNEMPKIHRGERERGPPFARNNQRDRKDVYYQPLELPIGLQYHFALFTFYTLQTLSARKIFNYFSVALAAFAEHFLDHALRAASSCFKRQGRFSLRQPRFPPILPCSTKKSLVNSMRQSISFSPLRCKRKISENNSCLSPTEVYSCCQMVRRTTIEQTPTFSRLCASVQFSLSGSTAQTAAF